MNTSKNYIINELKPIYLNNSSLLQSSNHRIKLAYKDLIINLLSSSNTVIAFTLTFSDKYKISHNQAEKDARHFKNLIDKQIFGKSNNKWKGRLPGCLVIEGDDYNDLLVGTHIHGVLGFKNNDALVCKNQIKYNWSKIRKSGFIDEIIEWDDNEKWINYLLKEATKSVPFYDSIAVLDKSTHR